MGYYEDLERQKKVVDMSEIVEKAKICWYWSLKPGKFLDSKKGKDLFPDIVKSPWQGTILDWNQSLIQACNSLACELFIELEEEDILHLSDVLHGKMATMLDGWHGKVVKNKDLPFDLAVIQSKSPNKESAYGCIKVLNMNEKGNII